MLSAMLAALLLAQSPDPTTAATPQTLHLGGQRSISGAVLKETDTAVFIDVGFDVIRVPVAAIVRRSGSAAQAATTARDEGIFFTGERPEKTIPEGAADVGEAVVRVNAASSFGSGFITSSAGFVVTNYHVVEDETEVDVVLYLQSADGGLDKRTLHKNKVIAINPVMDLALVKIEPPEGLQLKHVYFGNSADVTVGDEVYAIGTPKGFERTVSSGIVSVTNRAFQGRTHLQITTPINPGNSGGPLFNLRAEVVGVNTLSYRGMQGLNFSIPVKHVKNFLRDRDAFALDSTRSEGGLHYLPAPRKPK